MTVTKRDVDEVILAYCEAYERARRCSSVSGQLAKAAAYGCRVTGGKPPTPRCSGLYEAEKLLSCCTRPERKLLRARYQVGARKSEPHTYVINGETKERRYWVLCSYEVIAAALGISARAVRERIAVARAKVAEMLREKRGR